MKKLLIAAMMLFAFTMTFAQSTENPFKKNEISLAPYSYNYIFYNPSGSDGWQRNYFQHALLNSNYRRFLNENTALRLGGKVGYSSFSGLDLELRAGFEKYLSLSPKFQLYGGAELNLSGESLGNDQYRFYGTGVDFIGGLRYNINDKWSLSSEIIAPLKYYWAANGDANSWETGVIWQPLKVNFRF